MMFISICTLNVTGIWTAFDFLWFNSPAACCNEFVGTALSPFLQFNCVLRPLRGYNRVSGRGN